MAMELKPTIETTRVVLLTRAIFAYNMLVDFRESSEYVPWNGIYRELVPMEERIKSNVRDESYQVFLGINLHELVGRDKWVKNSINIISDTETRKKVNEFYREHRSTVKTLDTVRNKTLAHLDTSKWEELEFNIDMPEIKKMIVDLIPIVGYKATLMPK